MVTIQQAQQGISRFIDNEVLPHMTGIKKIGLGMYSALALQNAAGALEKLKTNPAIAMLNVIDDNGMIDIDALYNVAVPMFAEKQTFDLPVIGSVTFDRNDVEKLFRYIRG